MVERVARANHRLDFICDFGECAPADSTIAWDGLSRWSRKGYIEQARTAIEAAFQVTDEDAKVFFANGALFGGLDHFRERMQALSDAALKEPE